MIGVAQQRQPRSVREDKPAPAQIGLACDSHSPTRPAAEIDPYTRVDTVHSSRHVRVEIDGVTLGETRRPMLLFETGLPIRYYIPKLDVRMDLLEPSEYVTSCPYKGVARHWSARVGDKLAKDIVWSYPAPIPECPKIENLLSFYNEHVDLYVDGVPQDRPITPFS